MKPPKISQDAWDIIKEVCAAEEPDHRREYSDLVAEQAKQRVLDILRYRLGGASLDS